VLPIALSLYCELRAPGRTPELPDPGHVAL